MKLSTVSRLKDCITNVCLCVCILVIGSFCHIDWKLQQTNPSTVAMFRDLQDRSLMCQGTYLKTDLLDITRRARAYDAAVQAQNSTTLSPSFSVPPSGVVFHETRCGSTLTANLLASFSPLHTRVYTESPPPLAALKACDGLDKTNCNKDLHQQLIHDVFYMMGRTTRVERPQFLFYKFQSIGTHHIQTFAEAFPDTPWVFLYRDSIEVMQSHLQESKRANKKGNPVCARGFGSERQPEITKELIQYKGKQVQDVTIPEYCAAHLVRIFLFSVFFFLSSLVCLVGVYMYPCPPFVECSLYSSFLYMPTPLYLERLVFRNQLFENTNEPERDALSITINFQISCGNKSCHKISKFCLLAMS
jgi:hypothetical protein